ncbi:MAG TPA: SpoIVB peptidase S55 domain-containing protein, partial [Armatimonadota bacterium]|nr:SpoIVB peptidase S55 domain-containing protein [Armatimonadota bacterium]
MPTRVPGAKPQPPPRALPVPKQALPAVPPPGNLIMPVSEVRPGMKGYGLTVFRGTTIERFEVDILGVLPKTNMGQSLVLVKLSGGPISKRGAYLIQGMSGSPIYVNGKLLGAFSMGNAWPKEPQGMVTPIEDMLEALDPKLSEVPAGQTAYDLSPLDATGGEQDAATPGGGLFRTPAEQDAAPLTGQGIRPLALPVTVSGLTGARLQRLAQVLRPFNMSVMEGPSSSGLPPFKAELTPGAAIGVSLMTGDIDITSIGTVTYRKGDQLLAFGHPMMQIGAAQFPITTAFIHDVFSGFQVSHKIGSA